MAYQVGGIVDDADYAALVDKYNAAFSNVGGLGIGKKIEGEIVTRLDWFYLWQKVHDMAADQGRTVVLPEVAGHPGENPFSVELAATYNTLISALQPWGDLGPVPEVVSVCWAPLRVTGNEPTMASPPTGGGTSPTTTGGPINQNWNTPGEYNYVVPDYTTITVMVSAGGGGGAVNFFDQTPTYPGFAGGASSFAGVTAYGGSGGTGGYSGSLDSLETGYVPPSVPKGPDSGAVGGDSNVVGGGGKGGTGYGYSTYDITDGGPPAFLGAYTAGAGSAGGKSTKTWTAGSPGAPVPGSTIKVFVGAGGVGGCEQMKNYGTYGFMYKDENGNSLCGPGMVDCTGGYGGQGSVVLTGALKTVTVPGTPPPPPPPVANPTFITFRATLDKPSSKTVTVNYATSDIGGTAPPTAVTPFSQEYTTPGTYQFTVPNFTTMTVEVVGAGGGSGFGGNLDHPPSDTPPSVPAAGSKGGDSQFTTVVGQGGPGGPGTGNEGPAANGTGVGGDTNTSDGAVGGIAIQGSVQSGGTFDVYTPSYYAGGNGGKAVKTWTAGTPGSPGPGAVVTVIVGKGGRASSYGDYDCALILQPPSSWQKGYEFCMNVRGKDGSVKISGQAAAAGVNVTGAGHATAGQDYTPVSGTLTFAPGETYKDVQVPILPDNSIEPDEDFNITLSSPVNANLCATPTAVGVILGGTLPTVPGVPPPPPPPPPPPDVPGYWQGYYVAQLQLPCASCFWATQYWVWKATPNHPTPDLPLPKWGGPGQNGPSNPNGPDWTQGAFAVSNGDNAQWPVPQGKLSRGGDPYADPSQEMSTIYG